MDIPREAVLLFMFAVTASFAHADNIYVSNAGNNTIEKFDSSGNGTVFASSGLDWPRGLAFDSAGDLYVANQDNNTIEKFDSSGNGTVFASSGLDMPVGLAFDSAGNLYVASWHSDTIEKFDSSGNGTVFATASSGLAGPEGLAFDSSGNLYVANYWSDTIEKFNANGVGTVFASYLKTIRKIRLHRVVALLYMYQTKPPSSNGFIGQFEIDGKSRSTTWPSQGTSAEQGCGGRTRLRDSLSHGLGTTACTR